jgi:ADP-ribosyl-[dinitrogen reductase] hydrolase
LTPANLIISASCDADRRPNPAPINNGAPWDRDLKADLAAIKRSGAILLITLMEEHEFAMLCVSNLEAEAKAAGLEWRHLPIVDVSIPDERFEFAWPTVRQEVLEALVDGGRAVFHCRGGLGRTGLAAARFLVETGRQPDAAISIVRNARPDAIETSEQEDHIRNLIPRI